MIKLLYLFILLFTIFYICYSIFVFIYRYMLYTINSLDPINFNLNNLDQLNLIFYIVIFKNLLQIIINQ
jgi:hypothetical protein